MAKQIASVSPRLVSLSISIHKKFLQIDNNTKYLPQALQQFRVKICRKCHHSVLVCYVFSVIFGAFLLCAESGKTRRHVWLLAVVII